MLSSLLTFHPISNPTLTRLEELFELLVGHDAFPLAFGHFQLRRIFPRVYSQLRVLTPNRRADRAAEDGG